MDYFVIYYQNSCHLTWKFSQITLDLFVLFL